MRPDRPGSGWPGSSPSTGCAAWWRRRRSCSGPSGDRVKTDARDALLLARLLRLGEIVAVRVPPLEQEGARDLVRVREDVRGDLMRARHRTSKLLLRQGIVWSGGTAWTGAHHQWLSQQQFSQLGLQMAYDTTLEAVLLAQSRPDRLDKAICEMAALPAWSPVLTRLQCLHGISTLTAFGLAVEIGDWQRFTGSTIGAFPGLVPTESSGASRSQGSITKTGNTHARRLLVEAAWHHKRPYRTPSKAMRAAGMRPPRPPGPAGTPVTSACTSAGRRSPSARSAPWSANVAVARELAGWCWSLATLDPTSEQAPAARVGRR